MDDVDTGFSPDDPKEGRPYVVIACVGQQVRVVPQSTRGQRGVFVSDGVVEGLGPGRFVPWSAPVPVRYAAGREIVGHLPKQYLDRVIDQWRRRKPRRER